MALVCIGWATLSVLTPFYHPYARLWLPVEAFGWLFLGGVFVSIRSNVEVADRGAAMDLEPLVGSAPVVHSALRAVGSDRRSIFNRGRQSRARCSDRATR